MMATAAVQEAASVTVAVAASAAAAAAAVASAASAAALASLAAFHFLLNSLRFALVDGKLDGFIGVNELTQRK